MRSHPEQSFASRERSNRVLRIASRDGHSTDIVSVFLGQLADLSCEAERRALTLTVPELEWQPQLGANTIGMLLTHIAVAEAYWISVLAGRDQSESDQDQNVLRIIGLHPDDDGIPLSPSGTHPSTLTWPGAAAVRGATAAHARTL